jgi:hypothetical protein
MQRYLDDAPLDYFSKRAAAVVGDMRVGFDRNCSLQSNTPKIGAAARLAHKLLQDRT